MLLVALLLGAGAAVRAEQVTGIVGDTRLTFRADRLAPGVARTYVVARGADWLRIREIYPDAIDQPAYRYEVTIDGRVIGRREHTGFGFGPCSSFVAVPQWARHLERIVVRNTGRGGLLIQRVDAIRQRDLDTLKRDHAFGLFGLVAVHDPSGCARDTDYLRTNLPHGPGLYSGVAAELYYAGWEQRDIDVRVHPLLEHARRLGIAVLPFFVSWWAGTPLRVPDGLGGEFGDIRYQQITFSEDNAKSPQDPRLRALLGPQWDPRYGLTTPNAWSNTPWLTMNSDALNGYRYRRLPECVRSFVGAAKVTGAKVVGMCLENEPRYWDTQIDASFTGPKRAECWADFNPFTVAAAARDGVRLDPRDGLDAKERLWLLRNVARYSGRTAVAARSGVPKGYSLPVFTHTLQFPGFPGNTINRPMAEFGYVPGARLGLELMYGTLRDMERVRDWGLWANINREEGDGMPIEVHLWDLRLTYIRGALLYNSYNWQSIGRQRVMDYMATFARSMEKTDASAELTADREGRLRIALLPDVRAANYLVAEAGLPVSEHGAVIAEVADDRGHLLAFGRAEGPFLAGDARIALRFNEAFELGKGSAASIRLYGEKSGRSLSLVRGRLSLDLMRERAQSLYTIAHAALVR